MDTDREEQQERRKLARLIVSGRVDAIDKNSGRSLGMVCNIHEEGLMLFGSVNLKENKIYQIRLKPWEQVDVPPLELEVKCLWKRGDDGNENCWAGFRIVKASGDTLDMITRLGQ